MKSIEGFPHWGHRSGLMSPPGILLSCSASSVWCHAPHSVQLSSNLHFTSMKVDPAESRCSGRHAHGAISRPLLCVGAWECVPHLRCERRRPTIPGDQGGRRHAPSHHGLPGLIVEQNWLEELKRLVLRWARPNYFTERHHGRARGSFLTPQLAKPHEHQSSVWQFVELDPGTRECMSDDFRPCRGTAAAGANQLTRRSRTGRSSELACLSRSPRNQTPVPTGLRDTLSRWRTEDGTPSASAALRVEGSATHRRSFSLIHRRRHPSRWPLARTRTRPALTRSAIRARSNSAMTASDVHL